MGNLIDKIPEAYVRYDQAVLWKKPGGAHHAAFLKKGDKVKILAGWRYDERTWKDKNYIKVLAKNTRGYILAAALSDIELPPKRIYGNVYIHHLNPITIEDLRFSKDAVLDPENLICVSYDTHSALHYGDFSKVRSLPEERTKNDTIPWRLCMDGEQNGKIKKYS